MELIYNNLDECILIIDKFGNINFCNEALMKRLGYKLSEITNLHIREILFKNIESLKGLFKDQNPIADITLRAKNQEVISFYGKSFLNTWKEKEALVLILRPKKRGYEIEDLERLLDNIPYGSWIKRIDGLYIYANEAYASRFNKTRKEVVGLYDKDLWGEELSKNFRRDDNEVVKTKTPKLLEEKVSHKGFEQWLETYKAPIFDKNDNVKYTIGITRDITVSKKMQLELTKNRTHIDSVHNMIDKIKSYDAPYEILKSIGEGLFNYLGTDGMSVFIYDEKSSTLFPTMNLGIANKVFKFCDKLTIDKVIEEYLVKTNVYSGNKSIIDKEFLFKEATLNLKDVKYMGCYPISFNNELIGLLTMSYKYGNDPKLNQDDFISSTCNELGIIMKNYMLSEALKKEFDKRIETERELELFLNTAVDLICIVGADGYLKKVTFQCMETLGWNEEELLSMYFRDLLHPDDKEGIVKIKNLSQIMGGVNRFINRYRCKDGNYRYLQASASVIPERNVAIITAIDVTEEKELEEEKKSLQRAVELEGLKNELFANVSHEFKTPLNIILTTSQLLTGNLKGNEIVFNGLDLSKYLKSIRQNSYRLLRLINNFIDITKIDAGYYELELGNHNIVSVIEDITLSVAQYVEHKGIELIFDTNAEEQILACDPDKIERIMLNLLSNAIKYTDENGKIQVNFTLKGDKVVVSVKDNGSGIPKESLKVIFERFKQGDSTLRRRCEGSGIGLSLVKSLVNMHGGEIYVKSEINKGSEFTFYIPIKLVEGDIKESKGNHILDSKIEKCTIEFSDIYSL